MAATVQRLAATGLHRLSHGLSWMDEPCPDYYYGWVVVAVSALQVFFSGPGQTYSISNWKRRWTEQYGWRESTVSSLYAAGTTLSAALLPFVGRFVDRVGQRAASFVAGWGLVAACLAASFVDSTWSCGVSFFLLRFFGQGMMTMIPKTLIPQWFRAKRGRAFSFMQAGSFLAAVSFPPFDTFLIEGVGWRAAWRVLAGLAALAFLPAAYLCYRDRPEDVGEVIDGRREAAGGEGAAAAAAEEEEEEGGSSGQGARKRSGLAAAGDEEESWTLPEILRTRSFWALMHCNFERAAVNTALTFYIRDVVRAFAGLTELQAATLLSVQASVGFPVAMAVGFLSEKVEVHHVIATTFLIQALAIYILLSARSLGSCLVFAVAWGVAAGFEQISLQLVWPNHFGKDCLGALNGVVGSCVVFGSAMGPMVFGWAFDRVHSWDRILRLTCPWALATAVVTWRYGRKPYRMAVSGRMGVMYRRVSLEEEQEEGGDMEGVGGGGGGGVGSSKKGGVANGPERGAAPPGPTLPPPPPAGWSRYDPRNNS